jgi:hypothetical protein
MSASKPVSLLEQEYNLFDERTVKAGDRLRLATNSAGQLMRDMNRMHQVIAGLGVVMRILNGNTVLESECDPNDSDEGTSPLSKVATGMLTAMAAAMCEEMRDKMEHRAKDFNREVEA